MAGTLYVVATPIGNLEDLTFRALRVLREVDVVAAEDTRRTSRLLAHYDLRKSMTSYREHNEARAAQALVARLLNGESVALVTDAGTPGICDPGARLVAEARVAGVPVVPIPGPSAVTAALSASGCEADQFVFVGFPPAAGTARNRWFSQLSGEERVIVLFESPHRIRRTLTQLRAELGKRDIRTFRELTKIHEISVNYQNQSTDSVEDRGEFVVVVGRTGHQTGEKRPETEAVISLYDAILAGAAFSQTDAVSLTASALGCGESLVRKAIKRRDILAKQQKRASP